MKDDERLEVFLTNTLEPVEPIENRLLPELTAETKAAQGVKEMPILVITGNPPYSGHSKNKGAWITAAIAEYRVVWEKTASGLDEKKPLGEKNPKWLQDDYVKFIRFAQMKIDGYTFKSTAPDGKVIEHSVPGVERGIVGVINNHSWLDNPTFRGMRQSLMRSFEQIYVLDLHGNAKKKERAPDGSKDENVFDIEQGVAISILVKRPGLERGVWRGDLWGKRLSKYRATADGSRASLITTRVNPTAPNFLFLIQDENVRREYEQGWPINSAMPINSIAIVSGHDSLAYAFSKSELEKRLRDFLEADAEQARSKFGLGRDTADWNVAQAQEDARGGGQLVTASYRPFDHRFTLYTGRAGGFHVRPRHDVMQHLLAGNLAINVCRFITGKWQHALVVNGVADNCLISTKTKERGYIVPIIAAGHENFSPDFRAFLDTRYAHHYTPEEIVGYIYAVLHAPIYRTRYAEFLRIDFPRIPFPESKAEFDALSKLGWALVQAHLLRQLPRRDLAAYHGQGDHVIEAVRYDPKDQAVWINKTQYFKPVPQAVWDFHIGGYQVLDKYLKSRKGRTLSLDEINHFAAVADALAFTIDQMAKIDEAYGAAFPDRG